jgi:hypothetical protein
MLLLVAVAALVWVAIVAVFVATCVSAARADRVRPLTAPVSDQPILRLISSVG